MIDGDGGAGRVLQADGEELRDAAEDHEDANGQVDHAAARQLISIYSNTKTFFAQSEVVARVRANARLVSA